jgi:hypothetical protein
MAGVKKPYLAANNACILRLMNLFCQALENTGTGSV